jgi:hypothetical protein
MLEQAVAPKATIPITATRVQIVFTPPNSTVI